MNIVILRPNDGTQYWRCFEDPALALFHTLQDEGHVVTMSHRPVKDRHNIILGWQQFEAGSGKGAKDFSWTVWQLEQLGKWRFPGEPPWDVLEHADAVWDMDPQNIGILKSRGINATHVPVGYRPEVRSPSTGGKVVDVLMYGSTCGRRRDIFDALSEKCTTSYINNKQPLWSSDLAPAVSRARVVVNVHVDKYGIQEQVRITPVLSQGVAVVSERSPTNHYGIGIVEVPYDDIVDTTLALLADGWQAQADLGYEQICALPMRVP